MGKKTMIIGASENKSRYAQQAVKLLLDYSHEVVAIGKTEGEIYGVKIHAEHLEVDDIDTISLYINPKIQKLYYDYILEVKPNRVIFNPGAENHELYMLLKKNEIEVENACTLVLLRTHQF